MLLLTVVAEGQALRLPPGGAVTLHSGRGRDTATRGKAMHAVVVNLTINEPEADLRALRDRVVPLVSQAPGFVTGYWTRRGSAGLSMIVFDSEHTASAAAERLRSTMPDAVATLDNIDVREVVAHA
jgi:hypothetical protein